jgi:hypothetical protein
MDKEATVYPDKGILLSAKYQVVIEETSMYISKWEKSEWAAYSMIELIQLHSP